MFVQARRGRRVVWFQCSSASRKFLNLLGVAVAVARRWLFQCSSASRKFLNVDRNALTIREAASFSALQRAENSSIGSAKVAGLSFQESFSALQRAENSSMNRQRHAAAKIRMVSVLFSEPKIPQSIRTSPNSIKYCPFQCSSASRKFLNIPASRAVERDQKFQCSSASRKFLNRVHCVQRLLAR